MKETKDGKSKLEGALGAMGAIVKLLGKLDENPKERFEPAGCGPRHHLQAVSGHVVVGGKIRGGRSACCQRVHLGH